MHELTAAKPRHSSAPALRFNAETDSLLEGNGFELSVPRRKTGGSDIIDQAPMARNVKKPTPRS